MMNRNNAPFARLFACYMILGHAEARMRRAGPYALTQGAVSATDRALYTAAVRAEQRAFLHVWRTMDETMDDA